MAEHHVGHVVRSEPVLTQRAEQFVPRGDHARIDDDHRVSVRDQRHGPGHPPVVTVLADVPLVQHVHDSRAARRDCQITHASDHNRTPCHNGVSLLGLPYLDTVRALVALALGSLGRGCCVELIVKSLRAMAVVVAAAVMFVLGVAFYVASDAALSPSSLGASSDLGQAARWLEFVAALVGLVAACLASWEIAMRRDWAPAAEVAVLALGALLVTIGWLTIAAGDSDSGGAVVAAVGIGVWSLLALSRAARTSLAERGARGGLAELWLVAAAGLFVFAIGYGLSSAASSRGPAVAADCLEAVGIAALAGSLFLARSRGRLRSRPVTGVLLGLVLLAVSFLGMAIVTALTISSLTAFGAALAVVTAVGLAGAIFLGLAAWTRVTELYR